MADLQLWLKRHRPSLCTIQQQADGVHDVKANDSAYRSLVALLTTRKLVRFCNVILDLLRLDPC